MTTSSFIEKLLMFMRYEARGARIGAFWHIRKPFAPAKRAYRNATK
jgi:hypothetical protein